jgi:hypothetical protein
MWQLFSKESAVRIRFGPFTLDLERRQLTNAGENAAASP